MVKVKICGITNTGDAIWAANLGADYLGLVFARDSKRKVGLARAKEIADAVPPYIKKVGLFVDEEPGIVNKVLALCRLDVLQFHGQESPGYCNEFKGKAEIIKGFRMKDEESLNQISRYDVDFYLLDAFVEGETGGTGQTFNWDLALKVKEFGRPLFLAGGLNPGNVVQAVKKVQPYAVDVASGVESSPRKKNVESMKEFIDKIRKMR
ncbi:MAG: phosphoribosylanthranilate isomerase [Candidatus Omnitrophica bacterium]|nr:phosphoribosylanthranilate isomerase [Candidatus Omnitrophota bacterium]MBU4140488.1 phosphoribosylanthranilate isomerase [Candidatus Omnitrophota bacterium]